MRSWSPETVKSIFEWEYINGKDILYDISFIQKPTRGFLDAFFFQGLLERGTLGFGRGRAVREFFGFNRPHADTKKFVNVLGGGGR